MYYAKLVHHMSRSIKYILSSNKLKYEKQEGHDGPVSLHWVIGKIPSYQTLQYVGIGLKHKTPETGLKLVAIVQMSNSQ